MGETLLVVNIYALSARTDRDICFEMLRNHLQDYVGPVLIGGEFNCTLGPRLDRSFVSLPGRHDSVAQRRLLDRAHLSDVLDDDIE